MKLEHWLKRQRLSLVDFLVLHKLNTYEDLVKYCKKYGLKCNLDEGMKDVFEQFKKQQVVEKRSNNSRKTDSQPDKKRNSQRRQTNSDSARGSKTRSNKSKSVGRPSRKRKKDNEVESIHKRSKSASDE